MDKMDKIFFFKVTDKVGGSKKLFCLNSYK